MPSFVYAKGAEWATRRKVYFSGSTALVKGTGLCFDGDYYSSATGEAVTDPCDLRRGVVTLPDSSVNREFAGVVTQNYLARTSGQEVEIWECGGLAMISTGVDTTVDSTVLTCSASSADAGRFTKSGLAGRGTALALETDASGSLFESLDGSATTAWVDPSCTITKTGIGTASTAGDRVVILGGADDAYGGDATLGEMATKGIYTIVTAPTADTITIATDIGDVDVALYVIPAAEHTVLAYLYDGKESGLQEYISPQDAVAISAMAGGVTFICAGYTMAANSTYVLADETNDERRKVFVCLGALGTSDYVVTVTSGMQKDGSTALATATFDAAQEEVTLEWLGSYGGATAGVWVELAGAGYTAGS